MGKIYHKKFIALAVNLSFAFYNQASFATESPTLKPVASINTESLAKLGDYLAKVKRERIDGKDVDLEALVKRINSELAIYKQEKAQSKNAGALYQLIALLKESAEMSGKADFKKKAADKIAELNVIVGPLNPVHSDDHTKELIKIVNSYLFKRKSWVATEINWSAYSEMKPVMNNIRAAEDIRGRIITANIILGNFDKATGLAKAWVSDPKNSPQAKSEAIFRYVSLKKDDIDQNELQSFINEAKLQKIMNASQLAIMEATYFFLKKDYSSCEKTLQGLYAVPSSVDANVFYQTKDLLVRCINPLDRKKVETLYNVNLVSFSSDWQKNARDTSDLRFQILLDQRKEAFQTCNKVVTWYPQSEYYRVLRYLAICHILKQKGFLWSREVAKVYAAKNAEFKKMSQTSKTVELFMQLISETYGPAKPGAVTAQEVLLKSLDESDLLRLAIEKYGKK